MKLILQSIKALFRKIEASRTHWDTRRIVTKEYIFDGNTEGKETIQIREAMLLVKVDDIFPEVSSITSLSISYTNISEGRVDEYDLSPIDDVRMLGDIYSIDGGALYAPSGGEFEGVYIPNGLYFTYINNVKYVSKLSFTYNDGELKKLDVKYLPDEIREMPSKMEKKNPTGTGSFSLNRKADTTIGTKSFAEGTHTTASGDYSHAEGNNTTASGIQSHAEGNNTTASGGSSHVEGSYTTASSYSSHAEGSSTNKFSSVVTATNPTNAAIITAWKSKKFNLAKGTSSHVEGRDSLALGNYSHAEGNYTTASDNASHAEGTNTTASGKASHAEGSGTTASMYASHAEGSGTTASSDYSHAEGSGTTASAYDSHAEGYITTASGYDSHAEGNSTTASGESSHAEGSSSNKFSSVVTTANPTNTDIITAWKSKKFSLAKGVSSHVEGKDSLALGDYSHAEGYYTTASASNAHAEGNSTTASGINSHTEGSSTTASGSASHAEGASTTASGNSSHAEGSSATASGPNSHAEGVSTTASGANSHAEGQSTTASGNNSHSEGLGTVANSISSLVIGEYNAYDESKFGQNVTETTKDCSGTYYFGTEFNFSGTTGEFTIIGGFSTDDVEVAFDQGKIYMSSDYNASKESDNGYVDSTIYKLVSVENLATLTYNVEKITSVRRAESRATLDNAFAIGNGVTPMDRSNAATVDWSGNAWYAGDVYVGSTSGTNKDAGSKKLATEEYVNSVVPEIPSIPTVLPNPYALTFTGAVTGSYDGSEAVSVEIPSGGSGGGESAFRLINTVNISEEVSTITIDKDSGGNAFEISEVLIYFDNTTYATAEGTFYFRPLGQSRYNIACYNFISKTAGGNYQRWIYAKHIANGFWRAEFIMNTGHNVPMYSNPGEKITSFQLLGQTLAAGNIYIYGR